MPSLGVLAVIASPVFLPVGFQRPPESGFFILSSGKCIIACWKIKREGAFVSPMRLCKGLQGSTRHSGRRNLWRPSAWRNSLVEGGNFTRLPDRYGMGDNAFFMLC